MLRLPDQRQRRCQRQHLDDRIAALAVHPARVAVARTVHHPQLAAHLGPDARQANAEVHGLLTGRRTARAAHARQQARVESVDAGAARGRVEVHANRDAVVGRRGRRRRQRQRGGQTDGEDREQAPRK